MMVAVTRVVALVGAAAATNMNGLYQVNSVDKTNVPFNTDYASKGHEFFDVGFRAPGARP